ncbi:MAG: hypothetical protein AMS25_14910 [Gemmatimonas sp. SM23_52]|nr:MAG: hypothetical protein AMS25_14910 [Gemmatimonas sp. SM23_52]
MLIVLLAPTAAPSQVISLKTVPIATGDQFLIFPSRNQGMGGVSIALDDPLLDPFVNPAKGSRIQGAQLFATPSFYSVSGDGGAGRALPAGVLLSGGGWFGGALLSLQQIEMARQLVQPVFFRAEGVELLSEKSSNNIYAFGMLGTRLPDTNASLGVSIFWAGLDALQGVDLLYAGSQSIDQSGHMLDLRVGLYGELGGERAYELLVLHSRLDMTHDVTYVDWVFPDPVPPDTLGPIEPVPETRVETNLDRSNTWGLHLSYVQALSAPGWQIGGIFTGNWKTHPKIPNYEIMNIPRDPGDSFGLNFGLGVSRSLDKTIFGIDLIFEPIWADTWAEAAEPDTSVSGRVIPVGGKTVENDFSFTNALIRTGVGYRLDIIGLQLGLQVRSIDYELEQIDHIQESKRRQNESWIEWTPTWGVSLTFSEIEVRYQGRLTSGTGQPGTAWTPVAMDRFLAAEAAGMADFIVAPSGPLTLQDASAGAHQFSVSIPIQ